MISTCNPFLGGWETITVSIAEYTNNLSYLDNLLTIKSLAVVLLSLWVVKKVSRKKNKINWFYTFLRFGLAIAAGFSIQLINLDNFEFLTYDWRLRFSPAPPISNQVVTVSIDNDTIHQIGKVTETGIKIDSQYHLTFLKKLMAYKPMAIVYTINRESMIPIAGKDSEVQNLAEYTSNKPIYLGRDNVFNPNDPEESKFKAPYQNFKTLQSPITRDRETFGKDTVTRRAITYYDVFPTMHTLFAQKINSSLSKESIHGQFDFLNSKQILINYRPAGTYKHISFVDVLNDKIKPQNIKNKIILIGTHEADILSEYVFTPYSRKLYAMSNLEVHANILDTLILNNAPTKTPQWLSLLLSCLVSVLIVFVVLKVRPANGLAAILLTLFSLAFASYILFATFDIFLTITHPILAVFICYYFFIPYRLILENRKSWEYYHKNKLLMQVEELKSNFMRMMSHDLKTPLARIQGMTEVIAHDKNLNAEQEKALKTISESSEELTDFIGSILSLGRIESKEIKLNVQSKDINAILKRIIKKYDFQAQSKNIQIITEFEPLFSVQIDEDLIQQVFANLIENAIKYSPDNSKILVSTEEKDGKVFVQVADQGIGIDKKDIKEVFSKFYRSPDVTNGPIKGSGLGLYLANYFVKLHSGRIHVESELKHGSTFTVELPTELNV
ncbi:MAG: CHASE2 domain-containing protein [Bdellovibrionales bacterium]|nr:CHASE2 domain-containing protein [Bdellovibrionales bacterium]